MQSSVVGSQKLNFKSLICAVFCCKLQCKNYTQVVQTNQWWPLETRFITYFRSVHKNQYITTLHDIFKELQHSAAAGGRWGSLTKCGVTETTTVRRDCDGPSCRFIMKFREVIPVPIFQELKCFGTKALDGPLCLWRSVILAVEGNEERSKRNCISMGRRSPWRCIVTTMIHHTCRRG